MALREQIIKLAKENPELRKHLIPILKEAMEFPTQEALKKYLDEHPDADKTKHKVKETKGEEKKSEKGKGINKYKTQIDNVKSMRDVYYISQQVLNDKKVSQKEKDAFREKMRDKTWEFLGEGSKLG